MSFGGSGKLFATISHFPFSSIFNVTALEVGDDIATEGEEDWLVVERFASDGMSLSSLEQLTIFLA